MPRPSNMPGKSRPRVTLLLTGGTIGSGGSNELDRLDYVDLAKVLTDEEALPLYRFPEGVEVSTKQFSRIRSNDVDESFWLDLRRNILQIVAEDTDISGIVITHGTATLEETAYFLHLTLPTTVPVVLVGAQRPPTSISSDAQTNLYNAVLLAASPEAGGHGVLVAMDDQILSARDVIKSSNHALGTFQSRTHGPLGDIDPYGGVWFYRRELRKHTLESPFSSSIEQYPLPLPGVDIIPVWAGASARPIDDAVSSGVAGIVLASLPPSMNPTIIDAAVDRAVAVGVAVVQSSRAITGRVAQRHSFAERGLIASDTFSPQAARILLSLCLAAEYSLEQTAAAFTAH